MDHQGRPLFDGTAEVTPLLRYSAASFMGRQLNTVIQQLGQSVHFDVVMESSLTNLLKVMALNDAGIAWLPDYAIQAELNDGRLVPAGMPEWGCEIEVVLYRSDIRLHQSAERFWSSLSGRCQQGWSII